MDKLRLRKKQIQSHKFLCGWARVKPRSTWFKNCQVRAVNRPWERSLYLSLNSFQHEGLTDPITLSQQTGKVGFSRIPGALTHRCSWILLLFLHCKTFSDLIYHPSLNWQNITTLGNYKPSRASLASPILPGCSPPLCSIKKTVRSCDSLTSKKRISVNTLS